MSVSVELAELGVLLLQKDGQVAYGEGHAQNKDSKAMLSRDVQLVVCF
jgi:hypothetical protein